ncbi:TPA: hypothetical protein JL171_001815 [Escherichia coli]|nr:hypothetical protein [Escherichia coli]
MSLETSLELNNQLLTQHNALLERLITALASGVALRPDTVAQVQEYRETSGSPFITNWRKNSICACMMVMKKQSMKASPAISS